MVGASSVRVSSWLRCKSSTAIGGAPSAATVSSSLTHHGPLSKRHLRHRCQHQGCPRPCLLRPIYLPDSPLQGTDAARAPRKKKKKQTALGFQGLLGRTWFCSRRRRFAALRLQELSHKLNKLRDLVLVRIVLQAAMKHLLLQTEDQVLLQTKQLIAMRQLIQ